MIVWPWIDLRNCFTRLNYSGSTRKWPSMIYYPFIYMSWPWLWFDMLWHWTDLTSFPPADWLLLLIALFVSLLYLSILLYCIVLCAVNKICKNGSKESSKNSYEWMGAAAANSLHQMSFISITRLHFYIIVSVSTHLPIYMHRQSPLRVLRTFTWLRLQNWPKIIVNI